MKTISVIVPCFNEEDNVIPLSDAIIAEFSNYPQYNYEIIFIDNDSADHTREKLRELCAGNRRIRAIFNAKNFGQFNSPYYGLLQANGDCGILMAADFQDPPALIPQFIEGWEEGYKIVAAIKTKSKENPMMYALRGLYYKMIKKMSDVEQIEQFTGYALYDRAFIEVLKKLDDPTPFLRGIVAELGFRRKDIEFEQPLRRAGKTSNNFFRLFDAAMLSFTSYTKVGLRIATFLGMFGSAICLFIAFLYLILKLVHWYDFSAGMAPLLIGMCLLGSVQLFFIGLIGEYIMSINNRVKHRPLVVEEERINFPPVKGMPGREERKPEGKVMRPAGPDNRKGKDRNPENQSGKKENPENPPVKKGNGENQPSKKGNGENQPSKKGNGENQSSKKGNNENPSSGKDNNESQPSKKGNGEGQPSKKKNNENQPSGKGNNENQPSGKDMNENPGKQNPGRKNPGKERFERENPENKNGKNRKDAELVTAASEKQESEQPDKLKANREETV